MPNASVSGIAFNHSTSASPCSARGMSAAMVVHAPPWVTDGEFQIHGPVVQQHRPRDTVVEQDAHSGGGVRGGQAARRKLQDLAIILFSI